MVCKLRPKLEMGLEPQISWSCFCGGGEGGGAGKRLSWVDLGQFRHVT